jgi:3-oxo-5-alpha-steroid 4-dehydrogenase 1
VPPPASTRFHEGLPRGETALDLDAIYHWGVLVVFGTAFIAFPLLFWITVPYGGRHVSERWGPTLPAPLAWFLMELASPIFFLWAYDQGRSSGEPVSLVFATAFLLHYLHRAIIYPLRMLRSGKRTPALSAGVALLVNIANGTINGLAVSHVSTYGTSWLADPRFIVGAVLYIMGARINLQSDAILRRLRKPGQTGYSIPSGGLYRFVASPNYLGEIIQWAGWALATWSTGGLAFLCLTISNLAPRARANLRWYRSEFEDHPPERKALIPGIW